MTKKNNARAWRISIIYATVTALWIVLSDRVLVHVTRNIEHQATLQTVKGLFFISFTSALIYILLRYELHLQDQILVALSNSEAQWRSLVENAPDVILTVNRQGDIQFANASLAGYSAQEIFGTSIFDYVLPEQHTTVHDALRRVFETAVPVSFDLVTQSAHKSSVWYSTRMSPIMSDNQTRSAILIVRDITELKRTEEALRVSEEKYRQIVETAQEGIWTIDAESKTTFVNGRMAEMLGYTIAEMLGESMFVFMDQAARIQAEGNVKRRQQGIHEQHEFTFKRKDGSPLWTIVSTNPLLDPQGKYRGAQAMITDISDLKHAQQAEREQQVLAQALVDVAMALNTTLDIDMLLEQILGQLAHVMSYDAAYVMLIEDGVASVAQCWGFAPYGTEDAMRNLSVPVNDLPDFRWMLAHHQPFTVPAIHEFEDWVDLPPTRWARSFMAAPILHEQEVLGVLGLLSAAPHFFKPEHAPRLHAFTNQAAVALRNAQLYRQVQQHADELEQRVMERTAQLNHVKERIEAILNNSNDIIILCRTDGRIEQVNPAFYGNFQFKPGEAYDFSLTGLVIPEHREKLEQAFAGVVEMRQPGRLEVTFQSLHDTLFNADAVLSPIIEQSDRLLGVVCSLRDISQRKQMEAQLRHMLAYQMEMSDLKSRYVSMAAHDLRQPLAVIQNAVDLLQHYGDELPDSNKQSKYGHIRKSVDVMVAMLDDILTLGQVESGKLTLNPGPLDVMVFCQNLITEVSQAFGGPARIDLSCQGECSDAQLDARLLRHILGNLLSNALKYSPENSPVTFATRCTASQITFRIQDQGIGIPHADQAKLFETFYRASNVQGVTGTGLGLAIVKQSVELHGGTIEFESQVDTGTTFTITLPQNSFHKR